ncbi:YlbF family regulator [Bacillota bacterium Meth-B3]|nr:YlbF family regulator [Christensenellaceae bacterium]MEA5066068.1 YlbF family regulator [Eubacteriales bacterium]MEA5068912.1 YlbF family regulator [Christensenellaceae bacterium]
MNVYDQAHVLARALRESEEFQEYQRLRETAYEDATNKALLDEYKRLQFRMQARVASGQRMDEDDLKRMQQIASLLQFNADASAYLLAEFRFQKLMADLYKILADVAGIDLDMLTQG